MVLSVDCDYVMIEKTSLLTVKKKFKKKSSSIILECQFQSIFECVHMEASKRYYRMFSNLNDF